MPAVDEYEGGAASAAGMIAMVESGTVQPSRGWRMAADMDKFPHWGRKPSREALIQLTGANAAHWVGNDLREAGADKLPRSERKPFRGAFIRYTGANAAHEVVSGLQGGWHG